MKSATEFQLHFFVEIHHPSLKIIAYELSSNNWDLRLDLGSWVSLLHRFLHVFSEDFRSISARKGPRSWRQSARKAGGAGPWQGGRPGVNQLVSEGMVNSTKSVGLVALMTTQTANYKLLRFTNFVIRSGVVVVTQAVDSFFLCFFFHVLLSRLPSGFIFNFNAMIGISWMWPPPSNSGIFRLSDLLQLELLWAHPVKRDEPTNAQLMYKMMMTNEPNKLNKVYRASQPKNVS